MRGGLITLSAGLTLAAVVQLTGLDLWVSDLAYNFDLQNWAIDHSDSIWRPVLYDGPKALIIAFGLVLIAGIIRPAWLPKLRLSRREAVFLFICLATVPAVVGQVRQYSGVSCPRALQRYGGQIEDSFGRIDRSRFFQVGKAGNCWPSGHASGGFALLALAFLGRARRTRLQFAVFGLGVGGAMGIYQVLRGAHFASHVVATMLIALVLIQFIRTRLPP